MSQHPDTIYIIRHGEKPVQPPLTGVDFEGSPNAHSLLPQGWQRSGALMILFNPALGPLQAGLRTPTALVSPTWGRPGKTAQHRSHQTIQGLSDRLGIPIWSAVVPKSFDMLSVYNGKGLVDIDSKVGAVMETVERHAGLNYDRDFARGHARNQRDHDLPVEAERREQRRQRVADDRSQTVVDGRPFCARGRLRKRRQKPDQHHH